MTQRIVIRASLFLILLATLLCFRTSPPPTRTAVKAPVSPQTLSKPSVTPAPVWAVLYGKEFWRQPTSPRETNPSPSPNIDIHDVIDRVSHAFRTDSGPPSVKARDYHASIVGSSLEFTPASETENQSSTLKVTTTSAQIGSESIFSTRQISSEPWISGNTAQTALQSDPPFIQHLQARAQGVELSWILQDRPYGKGSLRIEAELEGLTYVGATDSGFLFADDSGTARARIGLATLVDSSGNRAELPTEIIDSRLVVQVSEDLLATAAYPIAIDPLISPEFGMDRPVSAITWGEDPKVTSNGVDYLVVWKDWRNGRDSDIYAARVSRDGWIMDPNGIGIRVGHAGQHNFAVGSNGIDYLVVWTEYGKTIQGARVSSSGELLDPNSFTVADSPLFPSNPVVAGNGDSFVVLWRDNRNSEFRGSLFGAVVPAAGQTRPTNEKLIDTERSIDSAAAIVPHGDGYAAVWRSEGKVEGRLLRVENGNIESYGTIDVPESAGPVTAPAVASGPGGILVAWEDVKNSGTTEKDIQGQLFTGNGQSKGPKFSICQAPGDQTHPAIGASPSGFVVAWQDNRRGQGDVFLHDIYFTRVLNDGTITVTDGQLLIAEPTEPTARGNQVQPVIASNGQQSLVVWLDTARNAGLSVRSARISDDGTILDARGAPVTVSTVNSQESPAVAATGSGFLVVWVDQRNGSDIYGARFTREGRILDPAGIPICVGHAAQTFVSVTSNGTDYFALWMDSRNFSNNYRTDIYGARITAAGTVLDTEGLAINSDSGFDFYPKAASDGANYLAVWQHRDVAGETTRVIARTVRGAGQALPSAAFTLSSATPNQWYPSVASNGREYIVVWEDYTEKESDIRGIRVSSAGATIGNAFPICPRPRYQVAALVASNGDGYFVTWLDGEYGASNFSPQNMFGSRLSPTGEVLDDPPILVHASAHFFVQRALASDGEDYFVLWKIGTGGIQGARISSHGVRLDDPALSIADSAGEQKQPALAAIGTSFLVAYTSSDSPGLFSRVRGKIVEFNLPSPWLDADVGITPTPGSASHLDGLFTVKGSGEHLSGEDEGFHFVYQTLQGDGQIIARINSLESPVPSGLAGIMIRESIGFGARHAFIGVNGRNQPLFARRRSSEGGTRVQVGDARSLPLWLKLIRAGKLILAYHSADGVTWQRFDSTTINFGENVLIGLAVTSHDPTLATAEFDRVSIWRFQAPLEMPVQTLRIHGDSPTPTLQLTGEIGDGFQLETSTNLIDWTPLQTIPNSSGAIELNEAQSPDAIRFYRLAPAD